MIPCYVGAESNHLQKQQVFLTSEPSLQLHTYLF